MFIVDWFCLGQFSSDCFIRIFSQQFKVDSFGSVCGHAVRKAKGVFTYEDESRPTIELKAFKAE
jgi:hypothetical protein